MPVDIDQIRQARDLIHGQVVRTPSVCSYALSSLSGADVVLKLESMQVTGSFKPRGALVRLLSLDEKARKKGVIAASAGNHAQGVAYHAQRLGIPATIVMPTGTPFTKVGRTEGLGAKVILHGENLADSRDYAVEIRAAQDLRFIHPYDDEKIIAGQGTVGLEMLDDDPDLDVIIVPIGGGGLIGGIATAVKALKPGIEIVGAEASLYPSMNQALSGKEVTCGGQTVADGIAVKVPGELTRPIVKELVSEVLLASETCLEHALQTYLEAQRLVVEGAGAASLAVLLENKDRFAGKKVGLVVSGGNIDSRLLSSILMRGLVREGRLVRLRVSITDAPGVLARVSGLIGDSGGNIVEVYHQRLYYDIPVKHAEVDVVIETQDVNHLNQIVEKLKDGGFPTRLLGATSTDSPG